MVYKTEHMLLQWSGAFATTAGAQATDSFTGSLRFAGPGLDAVDTDERGQRVADALKTWWLRNDNNIPFTARLAWIKWNRIGRDGRYVKGDQTRLIFYPAQVANQNAAVYPQQVAMASSFGTDIQRGKGSRGRVFWPTNIGINPELGMRATQASCTNFATAVGLLIDRLNVAVNGGTAVTYPNPGAVGTGTTQGDAAYCMASVMSNLGDGRTGQINRVIVGNRLDVQRRRDNATEEEYATKIVSAAQP